MATYPRQDTNRFTQASQRDLNPAVVQDGRVFVAPSDADAVFAFDAGSGRLLWKTDPIADDIKLSHVLGVAKGRLVVTGNRVLLFDVRNGTLRGAWPDSPNTFEGYGRGLLAGDRIYWPTRSEIQVLNQRSGLLAEPPVKLKETYRTDGGNLAAGDGYLVVAQADGLVVFCQNSRLIDRYREEIARAPDRASNYYRLARAAEAIGREAMAVESYRTAIARASPDETIGGISLAGAARDHLFRMLVRQAVRMRGEQRWEPAVRQLESAAGYARTDAERLESRLLLSDIQLDAGRPREAVAALEQVLLDPRLRPLPVAADDGRRTVRADLMVADRLATIVGRHGRACYAAYDRQAAALLERGRKERDPHVLAEVCRDYPVATVVSDALGELGGLYEASGRLAEAAYTYKRLLAAAADDEHRALAIWSMARVYERRKLFVSARDAYVDLAARYPGLRLEPGGVTMAGRVEEKLSRRALRSPARRAAPARPRPADGPPMVLGRAGRPGDQGIEHRRGRPVARSEPDRAARSPHPADARRGDRLGPLVGGPGLARGMGGLPRGSVDRRGWPPGRRPGPGIGDGPVAIPAGRRRQGCEPSRSVRRGRGRPRRGRRAQRPDPPWFPPGQGPRLLPARPQ